MTYTQPDQEPIATFEQVLGLSCTPLDFGAVMALVDDGLVPAPISKGGVLGWTVSDAEAVAKRLRNIYQGIRQAKGFIAEQIEGTK